MICPDCRLDNPDTAQRCSCGYDFEKEGINPNVPSHRKTSLKAIIVFCLGIGSLVAGGVSIAAFTGRFDTAWFIVFLIFGPLGMLLAIAAVGFGIAAIVDIRRSKVFLKGRPLLKLKLLVWFGIVSALASMSWCTGVFIAANQ